MANESTVLIGFLAAMTVALISLKMELDKFRKDVDKILTAFSIICKTNANGTTVQINSGKEKITK